LSKADRNAAIRDRKNFFWGQTEGKLMIRQTCRMKGHSTMKHNGQSSVLLHTFNYVIQEARSVGSGYNGAKHSREFGVWHTMPAEL